MSLWQIALIVAAALVAMAVLGLLARWASRAASPPPRVANVPDQLANVDWTLPEPEPLSKIVQSPPPEAARYAPRRHREAGADFASQPKPRSDLAIRGVPATQVNVTAPNDRPCEMRWQLENRDWTEWRTGSAAPPKLIKIIGYQWRLLG